MPNFPVPFDVQCKSDICWKSLCRFVLTDGGTHEKVKCGFMTQVCQKISNVVQGQNYKHNKCGWHKIDYSDLSSTGHIT